MAARECAGSALSVSPPPHTLFVRFNQTPHQTPPCNAEGYVTTSSCSGEQKMVMFWMQQQLQQQRDMVRVVVQTRISRKRLPRRSGDETR